MNYRTVRNIYINIIKFNLKIKLLSSNKYVIEYANGNKFWYLNGKLHREDGPAIEYANDNKLWYLNDQRHREDGPAIEYANGNKYWYLNGRYLTKEKFNELKDKYKNV